MADIKQLNITTADQTTATTYDINVVDGKIGSSQLASNAVTTTKIADSNVTTAKLADTAVTHAKIADNAIEDNNIKDGEVTRAKLASSAFDNTPTSSSTNLVNSGAIYAALNAILPSYPENDGSYQLIVTITLGVPTLSWELIS